MSRRAVLFLWATVAGLVGFAAADFPVGSVDTRARVLWEFPLTGPAEGYNVYALRFGETNFVRIASAQTNELRIEVEKLAAVAAIYVTSLKGAEEGLPGQIKWLVMPPQQVFLNYAVTVAATNALPRWGKGVDPQISQIPADLGKGPAVPEGGKP